MIETTDRTTYVLNFSPTPFVATRRQETRPAGETVQELVEALGLDPDGAHGVDVAGEPIERERWREVVIDAGLVVVVVARPSGIVSPQLVQSALSNFLGEVWGSIAAQLAFTAAAAYGVQRLYSQLIPPGLAEPEGRGGGTRTSVPSEVNGFAQYQRLPGVLGRRKFAPPYGAAPYVLAEGGKLVQYVVFSFGIGPVEFDEPAIGEEPLLAEGTAVSYTGTQEADGPAWSGVTLEFRKGTPTDAARTLYSADIVQQFIDVELTKGRGWVTRRTVADTVAFGLIVSFPAGLIYIDKDLKQRHATVRISTRYRKVGTETWTDGPFFRVRERTQDSYHAQKDVEGLEAGEYEIQMRRRTDGAALGVTDQSVWASIVARRSGEAPWTESNVASVSMRVPLSENLPNGVTEFTAVPAGLYLDWNGSTWVANQRSSNPATLIRHVLQGPQNLLAVADSGIDLASFQGFHGRCSSKGFEFNFIAGLGNDRSVFELCTMIAAAGRASFGQVDGKFAIIEDLPIAGTLPVNHFTPKNVTSFRVEREYVVKPHALKVAWTDPANGWVDTDRVVPDDSHTIDTATTFERLDLEGITDGDQAFKLGRYHLAVMLLRPDRYFIGTDWEHVNCTRGDYVVLQHEGSLLGIVSGRVTGVTLNGGGDCVSIDVSTGCVTEAAKSYAVRVRNPAASIYEPVTETGAVAFPGHTTLTFATPIDSADPHPEVGDVYSFGEITAETIDCKVLEVRPAADLTAIVVLVDAADAVLSADTEEIPAYDPQVTLPPNPLPPEPPKVRRTKAFVRGRLPAASTGRRGIQGGVTIQLEDGRVAVARAYNDRRSNR